MPQPWTELRRRTLATTRVFEVLASDRLSPRTGKVHEFGLIACGDWVNVVPITDDGDVVLIEQFRHGISANTVEVPGGMVDQGEEPIAAARRELLEETGYACRDIVPLGWVHPNPALQANRCYSFVALGCTRVAEPEFDSTEECRVRLEPTGCVADLVRDGTISHALVITAFSWAWIGGYLPR